MQRFLPTHLLRWFRQSARDLPWRASRDPYAIWVSEVMLQQTQVATVIPYFERFLVAFPTLVALAAAPEQAVLKLWEGLGYYRRARDLHRAARVLVAEHGGQLPNDPDAFRSLPGVGRYTVGAVLSQAFDRRLPIVDANVQRVLCRFFACAEDPKSKAVRDWAWSTAESLLPRQDVGAFNQALMELGQSVCTPRSPACLLCPVAAGCLARARGAQDVLPVKSVKAPPALVHEAAVVVQRGLDVLLVQRPSSARRWANMWEFPHAERAEGETDGETARRILLKVLGVKARLGRELTVVRHGVTRFDIRMKCLIARYVSGDLSNAFYQQGLWLRPEALAEYPLSRPQQQLAEAIRQHLSRK